MKTSNLLLTVALSLIAVKSIGPTQIQLTPNNNSGRMPASEKAEARKPQTKKNKLIALTKNECKAESKGEKLEADVKSNLTDKVAVIEKLKTETEPKSKEKKEKSKKENDQITSTNDHTDLIALMTQMTTLFTTQMQMQLQMQNQIMAMFGNIQNNPFSQVNPSSTVQNGNLGYLHQEIGIPFQSSPWSNSQNPFSMMPDMSRQLIPASPAINFSQNQQPIFSGFDLNNQPQTLIPVQLNASTPSFSFN